MPQTVANLADITKEVWTSNKLDKQFYDENPLLDKMERTSRYTLGNVASVPLHKGRAGSATILSAAGGTLNVADAQKVDKAQYQLSYQYHEIELQLGAINQTSGGQNSTVAALDLEVTGGVDDLRKQAMRQIVGDGNGYIAEFTTSTATNTLNLVTPTNGGRGFDAIVRGHIVPGQLVDIGTAGNPTSVASAVMVTNVIENGTAPQIVVSGGALTTPASGTFLSITGARVGAGSNELNGLRQIAGGTGTLGTLNPANVGEGFWAPSDVITGTAGGPAGTGATSLSLDLLLYMRQKVNQKTGKGTNTIVTSLVQQANFESLLMNQVRFANPDQLKAGGASLNWNGAEFMGLPDVYTPDLFMLTIEDFMIVTGEYSKPTWISDIMGVNKGLQWEQGTTRFMDALVYPFQLAVQRRNSHIAATGLTAN